MRFSVYVIITKAVIKPKEMIARAIFVTNHKINKCNLIQRLFGNRKSKGENFYKD